MTHVQPTCWNFSKKWLTVDNGDPVDVKGEPKKPHKTDFLDYY